MIWIYTFNDGYVYEGEVLTAIELEKIIEIHGTLNIMDVKSR